ncbi:MAG TPA: sugar phosphate isomerase/epimerase, partial [Edaphobacter sp.]
MAAATALLQIVPSVAALPAIPPVKPMEVGLLIVPFRAPEENFRRVRELGFNNCFLSLDGYIGSFTPAVVSEFRGLIAKYALLVTTVEVVGPGKLKWDFTEGPSTIGI